MSKATSFAPVADPAATVLILGSMPGQASLRAQQYYAHPRNAFWRIQGELIGAHPQLPYAERLRILTSRGIALWDVLATCVRVGSLDADIEDTSVVANDFPAFFQRNRSIRHVFFNGAKAWQCFQRHVVPTLAAESEPGTRHYRRLPSTSPAHAGMPYAKKLAAWRAVVQDSGLDLQ